MLARRSLIETPIYYSIGIDALRLGRACGGTVADSDSVLHSPPPSLGNTRVHLSATYMVSDISQPSFARTCNPYLLNLFPQGAPTMASSSSSSSWLPMTGRYSVSVGTSLTRSLKARKAGTTAKPSKLPEKDFFSFRCMYPPHPSIQLTHRVIHRVQTTLDQTLWTLLDLVSLRFKRARKLQRSPSNVQTSM